MQPEQPKPNENVWISREEYERLRQAEAQVTAAPTAWQPAGQPVVLPPAPITQPVQHKKTSDFRVVLTGIAAGLLIASLAFNGSIAITMSLVCVFLVLGAWTLFNVLQRRDQKTQVGVAASAIASETVAFEPKNVAKTLGKGLLIGGLIVVAAPLVYIGGMILIFMVFMTFSGGDAGS